MRICEGAVVSPTHLIPEAPQPYRHITARYLPVDDYISAHATFPKTPKRVGFSPVLPALLQRYCQG